MKRAGALVSKVGKRSKKDAAVPARLLALEARVALLERKLAEPAAAPSASARPRRTGPHCPGCRLPVRSAARGRCPWCGFVFEAVAELRRERRDP